MGHDDLGVKAGQVLANKYRVLKLLGTGGMGSVWRCEHLTLGSEVALKVIKPRIASNKNSMARFLREARAAARLRSPHVVQILDHGRDETINVAFIAMELLEGESLYGRLKREKTLSPALTARVATHVGRAIGKAHEIGIVHRDLKPDNIFLVKNDDEIVIKVLDFGIAKSTGMALESTEHSPQTQTGALLGTPYYMSPEQATAQKDVDHRSDLWSLAVITFECLLGCRPYQSDSLGDLVLQICTRDQPVPSEYGEVPPAFDAWFAKAQQRQPEDRFQSAKELTAALRAALLGSAGDTGQHDIANAHTHPAEGLSLAPPRGRAPLTPLVATEKGMFAGAAASDSQSPPDPSARSQSSSGSAVNQSALNQSALSVSALSLSQPGPAPNESAARSSGVVPTGPQPSLQEEEDAAQQLDSTEASPRASSTPSHAVPSSDPTSRGAASTMPAAAPSAAHAASAASGVAVVSALPLSNVDDRPETFGAVTAAPSVQRRTRRLVVGVVAVAALLVTGGLLATRLTEPPATTGDAAAEPTASVPADPLPTPLRTSVASAALDELPPAMLSASASASAWARPAASPPSVSQPPPPARGVPRPPPVHPAPPPSPQPRRDILDI